MLLEFKRGNKTITTECFNCNTKVHLFFLFSGRSSTSSLNGVVNGKDTSSMKNGSTGGGTLKNGLPTTPVGSTSGTPCSSARKESRKVSINDHPVNITPRYDICEKSTFGSFELTFLFLFQISRSLEQAPPVGRLH